MTTMKLIWERRIRLGLEYFDIDDQDFEFSFRVVKQAQVLYF